MTLNGFFIGSCFFSTLSMAQSGLITEPREGGYLYFDGVKSEVTLVPKKLLKDNDPRSCKATLKYTAVDGIVSKYGECGFVGGIDSDISPQVGLACVCDPVFNPWKISAQCSYADGTSGSDEITVTCLQD